MKHFVVLCIALTFSFSISSQSQLDVQGKTTSTDTVAKIKVNYTGPSNVVGLMVSSTPNGTSSSFGRAGLFIGGSTGIHGRATATSGFAGVYGQNEGNGSGVYGFSS